MDPIVKTRSLVFCKCIKIWRVSRVIPVALLVSVAKTLNVTKTVTKLALCWSANCLDRFYHSPAQFNLFCTTNSFLVRFPYLVFPKEAFLTYVLFTNCIMCMCYITQGLVAYRHDLLIKINTIMPHCPNMEVIPSSRKHRNRGNSIHPIRIIEAPKRNARTKIKKSWY